MTGKRSAQFFATQAKLLIVFGIRDYYLNLDRYNWQTFRLVL